MRIRQRIKIVILVVFLFPGLATSELRAQDRPRFRGMNGAWTEEQVVQWTVRVARWAHDKREIIHAWAVAEGIEPNLHTRRLDSIMRHVNALGQDPYNPYETSVVRELLIEVKGEFAIAAYTLEDTARNRRHASQMNEAIKEARDFNDATLDHADALTKWYAAYVPRPVW